MPNRPTHTKITLVVSAVSPLVLYGFGPQAGIPFLVGVLATIPVKIFGNRLYLNPDADIAINDSVIARGMGFTEYQRSVAHRKGMRWVDWKYIAKRPWKLFFFSHAPLVGTIPRAIIALTPVAILALMFGVIQYIRPEWVLFFYFGMAWSDVWHIIADTIGTFTKWRWLNEYGYSRGKTRVY